MDFSEMDINTFLQAALPNRFQGVDPLDFEGFISQLFLDNGYTITQTAYSGDYGADVLVEKDGLRTAIQVKRYHSDNKVGVAEVNQVIAAKAYYQCDAAMLITTSNFTKAAHEMADSTQTMLWDWNQLLHAVQKTYFDGQPYLDFATAPQSLDELDHGLVLEITEIGYESVEDQDYLVVYGEIENQSGHNLNLVLDLPDCLTAHNRQIKAAQWKEELFTGGTLYNGANAEIGVLFKTGLVERFNRKDRILIQAHLGNLGKSILLEQRLYENKGGCTGVILVLAITTAAYLLH